MPSKKQLSTLPSVSSQARFDTSTTFSASLLTFNVRGLAQVAVFETLHCQTRYKFN
ncbi:MAG: hypothetical protein BWX59_00387 [Bacteroidetes bacterium ADurb.Bin028]|nr:MAG: hypothetical protein BWX59_00387 [Bacteroidetes bacterium ADurb.Bin028]